MDDKQRLKVEFPVGDFMITVMQPTGEQQFVLAMSRQPKTDQDTVRLVTRLTSIMQRLTGEQWFSVIEENMIGERLTVSDLLTLVEDVLSFKWADHVPAQEAPEHDRSAVDLEPARPAPRVVGA